MKKIALLFKSQTIKDSFIVFVGLGITALLGFFYTIIMARTLRPESFGVFSAVTSLVAIVYSLGDLGIGPALINFLPKIKNKVKLIDSTFWFQYLVGLILAVSFWSVAKYSNLFIPGSTPEHFYLVGSLTFNYILVGWSQSIFTAEKKFLHLSASQSIDAIVKMVIILYLFKFGELSISTALVANSISAILALTVTFWKQLLKVNLNFDRETFTHVYQYSKWIAVSRFFSIFFSRIDIILLNLLATSYMAGIYAAASRITLLFALIVSGLGSVVNPRFSAFNSQKEAINYSKKLFLLLTGVSLMVLLCALFAKQIVFLAFGLSFFESIWIFQLLAISMIPFIYSVIFTASILYTFRQTGFYALITFIQLLVVIVINLLYIPKMGVYAPVLASAVSNLLVFIISAVKLKHLFKTQKILKQVVLHDTPQSP